MGALVGVPFIWSASGGGGLQGEPREYGYELFPGDEFPLTLSGLHNSLQVHDQKPSLTGPLPASLAAATALQYLQLANNGFSGNMIDLPANLK